MSIDLTDAAKAYGLHYVPPIREADLIDYLIVGDVEAGFSQRTHNITVFASLFQPPTEYDQARFASVGVGPLDTRGKAQFVLAHELWHARQDELDPAGLRTDNPQTREDHDANAYEVSADKHAAQVYKLVKIEGN